jgi:hypothetical protein
LAALLASPAALRTAGLIFFVYYALDGATIAFCLIKAIDQRLRPAMRGRLRTIRKLGIRTWLLLYVTWDLAPIALIFLFPHRGLIAWLAGIRLYLGYQGLLRKLYSDESEEADDGAP